MTTTKPKRQRLLPFDHQDAREQRRLERCQRILAGIPRGVVKPASEFDYAAASRIARGK